MKPFTLHTWLGFDNEEFPVKATGTIYIGSGSPDDPDEVTLDTVLAEAGSRMCILKPSNLVATLDDDSLDELKHQAIQQSRSNNEQDSMLDDEHEQFEMEEAEKTTKEILYPQP